MFTDLRGSGAYQELIAVSHRLGSDPLQVQGPGGNTSLKRAGAMWIKASGTWLAEAGTRDIMVPVDASVLSRALAADDPSQPDMAEFVPADANALGLRPSIETAVHAALDWPVVLHTHCVATIALAIRQDGASRIEERLGDIPIAFVPYVKPGWELAKAIRATVPASMQVIILGNHGLVVCGETAAEAEALLRTVSTRLTPATLHPPRAPDPALAGRLDGTGWIPAPDGQTNAIACDPGRLVQAFGATLYPDHLIFLGPGCVVVSDGDRPDRPREGPPRHLMLLPGFGAAIPKDATPAQRALAACLGNVLARSDPDARLTRLTPAEEADLLDWDAEKYRQSLNQTETAL